MKKTILISCLCFVFLMAFGYGEQTRPVAVSPGSDSGLVIVSQSCPTFSWSAVQWSNAYKVAVFPAVGAEVLTYEEMELMVSPIVSKEISGPALSWTPSEQERLTSGEAYVWYVQAVDASGIGVWSEGRLFQVDETVRILGVKEKLRESLKEYGMSETDIERVVTAATSDLQAVEVKENSKMAPAYTGIDQGTEGSSVTYYGLHAGENATGTLNAFFGSYAGYVTSGNENVFMGYAAGYRNTVGKGNAFLGHAAGTNNKGGSYNNFLGYHSGFANTSGSRNTFLGYAAGSSNLDGTNNSFLGYGTGLKNTSGDDNTFFGFGSGRNNTTANANTFLGNYSGYTNTTGTLNTFIGSYAGYYNNIYSYNTYIGNYAGYYNNDSYNTFIGYRAGYGASGGSAGYNTGIGHEAGEALTTGSYNAFLGSLAGNDVTTGGYNTFVGRRAGENVTTGTYNVCLGYDAGATTNFDHKLYIDCSSTTTPLIWGDFNTNEVRINSELGIGRNPATNDLEVNGTASKSAAGDWLANSDFRIKTDISDIEDAIGTVKKLHPIKFKYTDEWLEKNPSIEDKTYYNFIAQEYQKVFPKSVQGSGEYLDGDKDEILQLDSYNAQIVTIKAVQELIQKNEEQEKMINQLLEEIEILKSMLYSIEKK